MSEQLQHPSKQSRTARMRTHETGRHSERGFITPGIALGLGKAALAFVLLGTPIVAGASYAARDLGPNVMTGELGVTQPAKVELLETKIERELCIANAIVKVSAAMGFEGHPLGNDIEGNILWVDYNLNLEREHSAEVYRKIRYCMKGMDVPYAYDPNIAFGDPTKPAITSELSLSKIIVIVSALHDGRDTYNETSDGVLGYFASDMNKYLEQKAIQDRIGKKFAQGANVQAKIDTILRGALDAYMDKEAAIGCLRAGKDYKWQDSPIGKLLIQAAKEAIQEDFLNKDRNRPQPGAEDIAINVVSDIAVDENPEIIKQAENTDQENAYNLILSPTLENGAPRELDIAGIKIPIQYVPIPATSSTGTCVVTPESKIATLTPGEKGEE